MIGAGAGRLEAVRLVTDLFETLLPAMQRLGIVTAIEVDLPTLVDRIMKESQSGNAIVGRAEVGAWTRL